MVVLIQTLTIVQQTLLFRACMYSGVNISGMNAEVMPAQVYKYIQSYPKRMRRKRRPETYEI